MIAMCPLGSVVAVSAGQPAPKADEFSDEGMPFIRAGSLENLLNGGTLADCEKIPETTARKNRLRLYPKDTVVFAKSGMSATLGRVYRLPEPAYVVSHLATLVPTGEYDPRFLTYWLRRNPPSHLIKDPAYPSIRTSEIEQVQVPNPPLSEQERIAAILDKADGIRRKRAHALVLADNFLKSAFLDMFGDPIHNQKGLPTIALGELIKVSSGNGLTAKNMDPSGKYPVYGGNGVNGHHSEFMFEEPKIVIGRVGVYCGAIHVTHPKAWVTDNALYVRELKRPVNLTFLEWALRFANLNRYADRAAQPLISGNRIYPIEMVFPSDQEQRTFALIAERQRELRRSIESERIQALDLYASIAQRAFRGEL
jgi:type I restriction enzyme S subunit